VRHDARSGERYRRAFATAFFHATAPSAVNFTSFCSRRKA
jgi:hypothetical protein